MSAWVLPASALGGFLIGLNASSLAMAIILSSLWGIGCVAVDYLVSNN